jgi:hypothetical protein
MPIMERPDQGPDGCCPWVYPATAGAPRRFFRRTNSQEMDRVRGLKGEPAMIRRIRPPQAGASRIPEARFSRMLSGAAAREFVPRNGPLPTGS